MSGPHQGWAAQQHVPGCVCLLPAYCAEGRAAARVLAALALPGGRLPNPVTPLGGAGPVAGSELVDEHRGRPVPSDDGGGQPRAHELPVPPGRPGLGGAGSRHSGRRAVSGPDVHRSFSLVEGAGLLGDGVRSLITGESAVRRHPLQVDPPVSCRQSSEGPPDGDAQWGALGRRAVSEGGQGGLGVRAHHDGVLGV